MSILCAYGTSDGLGLASYYTLSCLFGVLAMGQARRMAQFLYAALAIAVAGAAMIAAYRLPSTDTDWIGVVTLMGAAVFMGIASAGLALPLQFLLSQFIGKTTALQLLEISRPDSPLLNTSSSVPPEPINTACKLPTWRNRRLNVSMPMHF